MRKLLRRCPPDQIELFAPLPSPRPHWQELPADVRLKTVRLLAQLLGEHARRKHNPRVFSVNQRASASQGRLRWAHAHFAFS